MEGQLHGLGDSLSRIQQDIKLQISNTALNLAKRGNMFTVNYPQENVFYPVSKVRKGEFPEEQIAAERLKS